MHCKPFALLVVGAALAVVGTVANAQQRQPERANVRCEGKIKAIRPGAVHVVGTEGQQWLIAIEAKPQDISFQGTTTKDFLRPGMFVQVRSVFDKKGEAQEPIKEVKVIAPREGVQLGIQAEGGPATPEFFGGREESAGKKKKKLPDNQLLSVSGALRGMKDNKVQIVAGGVALKAELAEDCAVSMDVSDYSLAREGDSITVQGWYFVGQPHQVHGTQMTIVAEQPVVIAVETKKRRGSSKGSKKDEPPGDFPDKEDTKGAQPAKDVGKNFPPNS